MSDLEIRVLSLFVVSIVSCCCSRALFIVPLARICREEGLGEKIDHLI
jgi:hypothetical protein